MLVLNTRIPGILTRSLSGRLPPSATSLCTHLPQTGRFEKISGSTESLFFPFKKCSTVRFLHTSSCSGSQVVTPKILGLFGWKNTEKIIGPSVLQYAMCRNFYSISKTKSAEPAPATLREPYGSVIRELEPAFRHAGLTKVYESGFSVRFSFGTNQFFDLVPTDHRRMMQLYFVDACGIRHVLDNLMSQFEPDAFARHWSTLDAIYNNFGMDLDDTPETTRIQGVQLCASLRCRHAIQFLVSNKAALADLSPIF